MPPHVARRWTSTNRGCATCPHGRLTTAFRGIACNQTGDNENGLVFPGNAVAFSPSGEIMERRLSGSAAMLVADLTAEQLQHVRSHRMRYFLPNRRPGLYTQTPMLTNLDR
jgi:hypothetical protein